MWRQSGAIERLRENSDGFDKIKVVIGDYSQMQRNGCDYKIATCKIDLEAEDFGIGSEIASLLERIEKPIDELPSWLDNPTENEVQQWQQRNRHYRERARNELAVLKPLSAAAIIDPNSRD